ncbi:MAG: HIT family protein [Chloroflexota bacterium]|nr:HIT family protein [Chloroflexota bacterium]
MVHNLHYREDEEVTPTVDTCIFCDIAAVRAPASLVYEDEVAVAFMTIGPVNPGHVLVVPREHAAYMAEMDEDTGAHLFRVTMRVAEAVRRSGVRCEGINLFLADGEAAFQEVFHVHIHVFPRFEGDAFRLSADWSVHPSREELDEVAAAIRRAASA